MEEDYALPLTAADCYPDGLSTTMISDIAAEVRVGMEPEASVPSYANSTPMAMLLMGTLLLAALNASSVVRALKAYRAELWSVRRRPNVFDDESSVPPLIAFILALIFVVFGGVVLYNVHGIPEPATFVGAAASMALLGAYYIFERCAYWIVGDTFTSAEGLRRWLGGFAATRAYAGLALIVPATLLVYQPQWHSTLITISLSIYFAARLLFIIKSFRIFYTKIWSSLYFILYLCTLEILPIAIIYRLSGLMNGIF